MSTPVDTSSSEPGPTQNAINVITSEIGEQALNILDDLLQSDAFKRRLKSSINPILDSIIDVASAKDDIIRAKVSQILRPYRDQYTMFIYAGAGFAGCMMFLLMTILVLVVMTRRTH